MSGLGALARGAFAPLPSEEARKTAAWSKAIVIPGSDPSNERWDHEMAVIRWPEYGLLTEYGWEIDHILERALGGSDDLSNLRARHWRLNRRAGGILSGLLTGRISGSSS